MLRSSRLFLVLILGALSLPLAAQVSLTTVGTPYTQNFDTLPASGSATWTNNSTIPGWFHARTGTGTTVVANDGASNAGNLYSYGTGTATDRALGSVGSGNAAVGNLFWGVRLQNNTGATITSLVVSYTGEQWRNGAAPAQTAVFSYLVGSPTVTGSLAEFQSAGTAVPNLDFTSPITGGTAGALNGNLTANRVSLNFTITGLTIAPGAEIMLRWSDIDHPSSDHGLSIDDFSVTPQGGGTSQPTLNISDVSQSEGNAGTSTFAFAVSLNAPAATDVTFDIATADDSATTADNDYVARSLTNQTIPAGALSYTFNVTVNGDTKGESDERFFVNVTNLSGANPGDLQGSGTIGNDDGVTITRIHDIQGTGATSPSNGAVRVIEGIVVGDYETSTKLNGFYVQEEDADADSDPTTSEGIFVFNNGPNAVNLGDLVRVTGTVAEAFGQTEIGVVTNITVVSSGNTLPTPATVTFPVAAVTDMERFEGMFVRFPQQLRVTDNYDLGRFGEVSLAFVPDYVPGTTFTRLMVGSQVAAPGAGNSPANLVTDLNNRSRVVLDTGSGLTYGNLAPTANWPQDGGGLSATNTLRLGDRVNVDAGGTYTPLVGVLGFDFSVYRIHPVPGNPIVFAPSDNPRPTVPPAVNGRVKVTSANVLNYFTTFGSRGADDDAEFLRQREKIIGAFKDMNPAVIAVSELENNNTTAIDDLVNGTVQHTLSLNSGNPGKWAYINTGVVGTDQIRVAFIYQPALVTPIAAPSVAAQTFDTNDDPRALTTRNRPAIAQTFQITGATKPNLQTFTVVANHFKSKGSDCNSAPSDPDLNDDQDNCNLSRVSFAQGLIDWLATNPTNDPASAADRKILIVGDLNAYLKEDPILALTNTSFSKAATAGFPSGFPANVNATYKDLVSTLGDKAGYSYLFGGESGALDHALANPSLFKLITGVSEWHINADEPVSLDYNSDFGGNGTAAAAQAKSGPQLAAYYSPLPFRTSDHDPLMISFNPLCGDLDDDGDVDAADQTIMRNAIGKPIATVDRRTDFDLDGKITVTDFTKWSQCAASFQR